MSADRRKKIRDGQRSLDYSKRPYIPRGKRKSYAVEERLATDHYYDAVALRKHSEDKKPYREIDYPEMEYFWTPFVPKPYYPDLPDDPIFPDRPPRFGEPPPDEPIPPSLGCFFYWPFDPQEITAGEVAFARLAKNDDIIVKLELTNPAPVDILEPAGYIGICTNNVVYGGGVKKTWVGWDPHCTLHVRAYDDLSAWIDDADVTGQIFYEVKATTKHGYKCYASGYVAPCPAIVELACDSGNPATVAASDSVSLNIVGGLKKFIYSVSGTGAWLDAGFTITSLKKSDRNITIYTDADACGTITLSVTDECGDNISCYVRAEAGVWNNYAGCFCPGDGVSETSLPAVLRVEHTECKQYDDYTFVASCTSGACGCTDCVAACSSVDLCLVPQEGMVGFCPGGESYQGETEPGQSGISCCHLACDPPEAGKDQNRRCLGHDAGYPNYDLWECA